jgi:CHAT domain-containing protein
MESVLGVDAKRYVESRNAAITNAKLVEIQQAHKVGTAGDEKKYSDAQLLMYKTADEKTESEFGLLQAELSSKHPDFRRISGQEPPRYSDLRELARKHPDTLFLEYADTGEGVDAYALRGTRKVVHWLLGLEPKRFTNLVELYMNAVETNESEEKKIAGQLFEALLGPLAKAGLLDGSKVKRIVFVPDGIMSCIPMGALMMPGGTRLIERFAISSATSLGAFLWPKNERKALKEALVVADTCGGKGSDRTTSLRGSEFGALPHARVEGEHVFANYQNSRMLPGSAATKATVEKAMPLYRILHFACHGEIDRRDPMYSTLVMAPNPSEPSEQFLTAREIMGIPLSAEIAVLSGCETGQGALSGGEGLMGLAWAFRAAGCPAVVASKWDVEDESTERIMVPFYQHLKHGERKDDALRASMLEEMKHPHPKAHSNAFYWAAFQVIGDSSPIGSR